MFFFLSIVYVFFFFSKNLFYKLIFFLIFYITSILFFLIIKKDIFGFFLMLLNASALIIFFTFLVLSINFKAENKPKKNFIFLILLKLFFILITLKQKVFMFYLQYFPLIDLNSNLIFSINDLQKIGFLMYYYFFF